MRVLVGVVPQSRMDGTIQAPCALADHTDQVRVLDQSQSLNVLSSLLAYRAGSVGSILAYS